MGRRQGVALNRGEAMLRPFVVLTLAGLGGCASYDLTEAPPKAKQATEVRVSSAAKSNPNFIQIYPLPESSTFILVRLDAQSNAVGSVVGGVGGLAVAAGGYSAAKDRVREAIAGNENSLAVDMVALTNAIVDAKIKEAGVGNEMRIGTGAAAKGTQSLTLQPYVVLAFVSASTARPFVFVDAVLKDEKGSELWEARFIGTTMEARALVGDGSWSSNSGKPLRDGVAQAADYALSTAVRDFSGKLPRADARDAVLRTQLFLYAEREFDWPVRLIESNDKAIVFVPNAKGGPWFGGIYSLPRESATIRVQAR
jgi:hypothetical protein